MKGTLSKPSPRMISIFAKSFGWKMMLDMDPKPCLEKDIKAIYAFLILWGVIVGR